MRGLVGHFRILGAMVVQTGNRDEVHPVAKNILFLCTVPTFSPSFHVQKLAHRRCCEASRSSHINLQSVGWSNSGRRSPQSKVVEIGASIANGRYCRFMRFVVTFEEPASGRERLKHMAQKPTRSERPERHPSCCIHTFSIIR